ncbi:MAG: peptidylprolyl isomerase [Victivallales bacterium]|nr:peptidylprolyl isomerase [Victivallales bacterium]
MKYIHALLLVSIAFPLSLVHTQSTEPAVAPISEPHHQTTEADLKNTIEKLQPDSIVLEIDGKTASWRELYPHIQPLVESLNTSESANKTSTGDAIRTIMQKLVARRMFVMEAKKLELIPDTEARKKIESDIETNLKADKQSKYKSLSQYMASFEMVSPNLLNVSFDELINVMYLSEKLFENIQLTDEEIDLYIRYKKAVKQGIDGLNVERREAMQKLAQDPDLQTNEGFKKLAKEYSEGVEAEWGGELKYDFTREELAEVNEIKEFNWKVGDVTPMLETSSAYRIMKVLRSIPPETADAPEKLRVAQILCGKLGETENLKDKEAIREKLTPLKQKAAIDEYIYKMSLDYAVKTPLFPEGLWKKPMVSSSSPNSSQSETKKEE